MAFFTKPIQKAPILKVQIFSKKKKKIEALIV
jgi:hypothetical protein